MAISDVSLALIRINSRDKTKYQVLMKRLLKTNKSNDVQFNLAENTSYSFNIYLSDNDNENRVGIMNKTLIFK